MKSNSKHELVKLLSICGQVAEHKSEKMQEQGIEESAILSPLYYDKQQELKTPLKSGCADPGKLRHVQFVIFSFLCQ